jgi:hypothetical protein
MSDCLVSFVQQGKEKNAAHALGGSVEEKRGSGNPGVD